MKQLKFLSLAMVLFTAFQVSAQDRTSVELSAPIVQLAYGAGSFPEGAVQDPEGLFKLEAPTGLFITQIEIVENFDLMCDVQVPKSLEPSFFLMEVGPSAAESSRCVVQVSLSNGSTVQVNGLFSSGE